MDDLVKAEYDKILTKMILKHGSLLSGDWPASEEYGSGWRGPRHSVECGIAKTGWIDEDATWHEFVGTFADDGDGIRHGMEVHGVTCSCGKIKDRTFRWSASLGEAIRIVMEELLIEKMEREDGKEDSEQKGS